ncbi:hypothetical protein BZG36_01510 [Bifiguratus adelaidae]|uniref:Protein kinase domain-containing protein n=1 Tax=Bifiguratus adelaidae TaxID=1938954 RepID=A0A261Y4Y5_9FUNG|nr:hypothetical protein BZG36_01510 [Bifiguratus adelaidae]
MADLAESLFKLKNFGFHTSPATSPQLTGFARPPSASSDRRQGREVNHDVNGGNGPLDWNALRQNLTEGITTLSKGLSSGSFLGSWLVPGTGEAEDDQEDSGSPALPSPDKRTIPAKTFSHASPVTQVNKAHARSTSHDTPAIDIPRRDPLLVAHQSSESSILSTSMDAQCRIQITIVEARNLNLFTPAAQACVYAVCEYGQNCVVTGESGPGVGGSAEADIFTLAKMASCPQWRFDCEFPSPKQPYPVLVTLYNRNKASDGKEVCLGRACIQLKALDGSTLDTWLKLGPLEPSESASAITGDVRVQVTWVDAPSSKSNKPSLRDYQVIRPLARGSFGAVYLVRKRLAGHRDRHELDSPLSSSTSSIPLYALKVLSKRRLIATSSIRHTLSERSVLVATSLAQHPFIVRLHSAFQDPERLFFVMDFVGGGELFYHLERQGGRGFHVNTVRFLGAEVVEAIGWLHSCGIVYRDLKPENILLDPEGHIRLTDFGLCKPDLPQAPDHHTNTFCGTSEYVAPEMIKAQGYGYSVDWWAVGILLYEMGTGNVPFSHPNLKQLYAMISTSSVRYPPSMPANLRDLVSSLLVKDPVHRLGCAKDATESIPGQVKNHPFWGGLDWNLLKRRGIASPLKPVGPWGPVSELTKPPSNRDASASAHPKHAVKTQSYTVPVPSVVPTSRAPPGDDVDTILSASVSTVSTLDTDAIDAPGGRVGSTPLSGTWQREFLGFSYAGSVADPFDSPLPSRLDSASRIKSCSLEPDAPPLAQSLEHRPRQRVCSQESDDVTATFGIKTGNGQAEPEEVVEEDEDDEEDNDDEWEDV